MLGDATVGDGTDYRRLANGQRSKSPSRSWRSNFMAAATEQGQADRSRRSRSTRPRTSKARPRCELLGLPNEVTTESKGNHQGHDRTRLPGEDDGQLAGRQARDGDLPWRRSWPTANRSCTRWAPANCGSTSRCRPRPMPRSRLLPAPMPEAGADARETIEPAGKAPPGTTTSQSRACRQAAGEAK